MSPVAGQRGLPADFWRGRRVAVMGLGTHGGGVGAVRFLAEQGARITLTDSRPADALRESLSQLRDVRFERVQLGQHCGDDVRNAEAVIVNPAVRFDHPLLRPVRERGALITTEVGLLWQHSTAPVVAVTGSVGKSTTVSMIDSVLRHASRQSWLGGNIGGSLLPHVPSIATNDWIVLELSSFQLSYLSEVGFRPEVAVVTNFSENHLDWHGSLTHYRNCKQQLLAQQLPDDVAILNADDHDVSAWPTRGNVVWFGNAGASPRDVNQRHTSLDNEGITTAGFPRNLQMTWSDVPRIHGNAMRQNAAAAIAACLSMQIEPDSIAAGLKTFTPLPHRCENLGTVAGRHWINDSKATTPAAAMAAIRSCDAKPWVLLGGSGKDVDLRQFCDSIAQQVRGAALIGEKNGELYALLRRFNSNLPLRMCRSMIEAVHWLAQASSAGDVVLLSPACASLDQFRDYADRGNQFRDAVLGLKDSSSNAAMAAVDHAA